MTFLAGVSGSIAWGSPYLILPLLPSFEPYQPGNGWQVPLIEYIISFSIASGIAACIFLVAFNKSPFYSGLRPRSNLSLSTMIAIVVGALIGGTFSAVIGHGVAYSPLVDAFMSFLDIQDSLPEPFLSIGSIIGAGVFASIASSFSNFPEDASLSEDMPTPSTIVLVSQFSVSALAGRIVVSILMAIINAFAFVIYDLFPAVVIAEFIGGFVFGALAWYLCIGRKAA